MKLVRWMMVAAAFLVFAGAMNPLAAQCKGCEGEKGGCEEGKCEKGDCEDCEDEDDDDPVAMYRKMVKDLKDVTGEVTFTQADIDSMAEHMPELDKLMDDDEEFEDLKEKSIKEAFDYVIKSDKFVKWAKEKGLDETWMRKCLRIMTCRWKMMIPEQKKTMEEALTEIENQREEMGEEMYAMYKEMIEEQAKMLADIEKIFDTDVPGPTDDEKKLLEDEENLEKIDNATSDDEDDDWEDEE